MHVHGVVIITTTYWAKWLSGGHLSSLSSLWHLSKWPKWCKLMCSFPDGPFSHSQRNRVLLPFSILRSTQKEPFLIRQLCWTVRWGKVKGLGSFHLKIWMFNPFWEQLKTLLKTSQRVESSMASTKSSTRHCRSLSNPTHPFYASSQAGPSSGPHIATNLDSPGCNLVVSYVQFYWLPAVNVGLSFWNYKVPTDMLGTCQETKWRVVPQWWVLKEYRAGALPMRRIAHQEGWKII